MTLRLRVPSKPLSQQQPASAPSTAPSGTAPKASIAVATTTPVVATPMTAHRMWQTSVLPLCSRVLVDAARANVTASDLISAFSAVKNLLDGGLLQPDDVKITSAGPIPSTLQQHLRGLLFVHQRIVQLGEDSCGLDRPQVRHHPAVITADIVRRFGDFDFAAYVLHAAIFSRYNQEICMHASHKFGDCQCASQAQRYFADSMSALTEFRSVWRRRVLDPARSSLEVFVRTFLKHLLGGDHGDAKITLLILEMARKTGDLDWFANVIAGDLQAHCQILAKELATMADPAASVLRARDVVNDIKFRLIDQMAPFPPLQKQLSGVVAAILVLSQRAAWERVLSAWLRDLRFGPSMALWELRSFSCFAGSDGSWFVKAAREAAKGFMSELLTSFTTSDPEQKTASFYRDVLSNFDMTCHTWAKNSTTLPDPLIADLLGAGYAHMFGGAADVADMCANLCAMVLHSAAQSKDAASRDEMVECVAVALRYLKSCDVFEAKMKELMERRFIYGSTADVTFEDELIERMAQVSTKLAREMDQLRSDVRRSGEFPMTNLVQPGEPQFTALVLQSARWNVPKAVPMSVNVPALQNQMRRYTQRFSVDQNNSHRVLSWCLTMSTARVALLYTKSSHVVAMPLVAALALCAFDQLRVSRLTKADIAHQLGVREPSAEAAVSSQLLTLVKAELLRCVGPDSYEVCLDFKPKTKLRESNILPKAGLRLVTPATVQVADPQKAADAAEVAEAKANLNRERNGVLECAIVKVMKSNKVMQHHDLVTSVLATLREKFTPTQSQLKAAIERLIDKDFLKRDADDKGVYAYVA